MFDDFSNFTKEDFNLTGRIGQVFDQALQKKRKELLERNQLEKGLKKSAIIKAIMDSLFEAIDWKSYSAKYIALSEADDWEIQSVLFPFCDIMVEYLIKPEPGDPPVPNQPGKFTCSMNVKVRKKREQSFLHDGVMYLFSNVYGVGESTIPKRLLPSKMFKVLEQIKKLHTETNNPFIAKINLIHRGFRESIYQSNDIIVNGKYSIGALITAFTVYEAYSIPENAIIYQNHSYSISGLVVAPGAYVSSRYLYIHSETKRHFDKIIAFLEKKPYLRFSIEEVEKSAQKYFMDRDISGFSILNLFIQDNAALTADKRGHITISLGEALYGMFPQKKYFSAFLRAMNEWNQMGYNTEDIEFIPYIRGNGPAVNAEKRIELMEEHQRNRQKMRKRK